MHSKLTDRSVVIFRGGPRHHDRKQSLRSGSSAYHGLREKRDVYDLHIQTDGSLLHKGKKVDPRRIFQSNATVFNALQKQSAASLSKAAKQYGAKHTGNSHMHYAELKNAQSRRKVLRNHNISTIPHWKLKVSKEGQDKIPQKAIQKNLAYPVIITPLPDSYSHDSVIAETRDELEEIISKLTGRQKKVYLQSGVRGQRYSGLVMPRFRKQKPYIFPLFERQSKSSFANAYQNTESPYKSTTKSNHNDIQKIIERVFQALGFHCLARVDVVRSREGNRYVHDVETHPRLDRHSLLADSVDRIGTLLKDVYHQQVDNARRR